MEIVIEAKAYLKSQNIDQWQDGYPNEEGLLKDIQNDSLYIRHTAFRRISDMLLQT